MSPEFWQRLLAAGMSPQKCRDILRDLGTSSSDAVNRLLASRRLSDAEKDRANKANIELLRSLLDQGVEIVERRDFPPLLRDSAVAPPALFIWGDRSCLNAPCIAIVGTRAATTYGKAVAQKFAEAFARSGVTVVSGGALGIDAAAHKGAMEAGGNTAAVLITGIERTYPRVHFGLFQQIRQNGCLISQFAAGTNTAREFRPLIRNQTVAAMSSAVVVIEAPEKSGALSTAHTANELGRQVFVVPANIDNLNFRGSHSLIRDGAPLVDHPDQVMEALAISPISIQHSATAVSEPQSRILSVLSSQPLSTEFIVERTGLDPVEILSELTLLELEGRVFRDAGGFALRL